MRVVCFLIVSIFAGMAYGQAPPEPFTFASEPKTQPMPPATWWCIAASPDGKTILAGLQRQGRGELLVWDTITGQVVATRNEPKGIRCVGFSPDGSLFATGNFDNVLRLYDTKTRQLLATSGNNGHTSGINGISFSADGKRLATAGLDQQIRLWSFADIPRTPPTSDRVPTIEPKHILEGHTAGVLCVALSPDGSRVLSGSFDRTVRLWAIPADAGRRISKEDRLLEGHGAAVESVAWSSNGQRLATGSWDNTARLWDRDGKEIAVLRGHTRGILALAFSADSQTLLTASGDENSPAAGELRLWGAERGTDLGLLGKHEDMIRGVTFAGSNRAVASVGRDRVVRWWNTSTKAQERQWRTADDSAPLRPVITAMAYSPDGRQLALADDTGTIQLVDRATNTVVTRWQGHPETIHAIAWVPKQSQLISVGNDRSVVVWDVTKKQPKHTLKQPSVTYALAVSPDGTQFAVGGFDKTVRVYDTATGQQKAQKIGHTASIRSLAFSPTGQRLASGSSDFTIRLWAVDGEQSTELHDHLRAVRAVRFIDEHTLVSTSDDRLVKVWNLKENEVRHTLGPLAESVVALAVSPRGRFFVVGTADGSIHVYDSVERWQRAMLTGPTDGVAALAIAPDGQEIAAGSYDRQWRRWGPAEYVIPLGLRLVGHQGAVRAIAFAPDADLVLTGGADGTVRQWNAGTGQELHQWAAHSGGVADVAWSRDGRWLLTGGVDGTAKLWDATNRQLVRTISPKVGLLRCVAISHDGKTIALSGAENHLLIYDRVQQEPLTTLTLDSPAKQARFMNDEHLLLTTTNGSAQYWHTREKRVLRDLKGNRFAYVKACAGSLDGGYIVVAGREPLVAGSRAPQKSSDLVTLMFDTPTTSVSSTSMYRGLDEIVDVVTSEQGNVFVATQADGRMMVWENSGAGKDPLRLQQFYAHAAHIEAVAISADGQWIATASADGTARLWTGARGQPLIYAAKLLDERKQTWFARQSPNGRLLATGGDDQVIHLRNAIPGSYRSWVGEFGAAHASAASPNGAHVVTGHNDGSLRVWDCNKGTVLHHVDEHSQRINAIAFNADGSRVVSVSGLSGSGQAGEIRIWDTATWKPLQKITGQRGAIHTVAFAPDGQSFATGGEDRMIRIWDTAKGTNTHTLNHHSEAVRSLLYAHEGRWLVSISNDRQLMWYDLANSKVLGTRPFNGISCEKMRLAPDGKTLALTIRTPRNTGHFVVLDLEKNTLLHENKSFLGQVNDVAFSPDGQTLVAVGGYPAMNPMVVRGATGPFVAQVTQQPSPGLPFQTMLFPAAEIKFFDVKSGRPIAEFASSSHWVESVQFTPDGKQLITAGGYHDRYGEVRVWDTAGLRPFMTLAGHRSTVACAAFNHDGSLLATGGQGHVLLWSMANVHRGEVPTPIQLAGHEGLVRQVRFTADGKRLLSAGDDGNVNIWNTRGERVQTIRAHRLPVYGFDLNADGTQLATAAGDWRKNAAGEVRVWDMAQGTEILRLADQPTSAWSVAFTSNGLLAVGQQGSTPVKLFDLRTKQEVRHLNFADDLRSFGKIGNSPWLAGMGGRNGLLKVWDHRRWNELYEVPAHVGKVAFMVDANTNGQTLITAGGDAAAVIWQVPREGWAIPTMPKLLMPVAQP